LKHAGIADTSIAWYLLGHSGHWAGAMEMSPLWEEAPGCAHQLLSWPEGALQFGRLIASHHRIAVCSNSAMFVAVQYIVGDVCQHFHGCIADRATGRLSLLLLHRGSRCYHPAMRERQGHHQSLSLT